MSDWWAGVAPAEVTVPCAGEDHQVRWERGRLIACHHGEVEDERTLATSGVRRLDASSWSVPGSDTSTTCAVLVIGPRGGYDELPVDPDATGAGGVRYSRRRRRGGGAAGSGPRNCRRSSR